MDYRTQDKTALYEQLLELPKIELHRHLEGSLRLETLAEIARKHDLDLPGYKVDAFRHLVQVMPGEPLGADTFLSKFIPLRGFYVSPDIIQRVAYESVLDAAQENIIYMELRFTPIALAKRMNYTFDEVIGWVAEAVDRGAKETGVDIGLIISMNRNESVELGSKVVDAGIRHMEHGVVAVDLAGAEHRFPGHPFEDVFKKAKNAGMAITVHAGEWAGPESIAEAIDLLDATRIGHGISVTKDNDLMQRAQDKNIAFEVCVTSNLQTGAVKSIGKHPLKKMREHNLITTINTDDPSISGICLTDEYVTVVDDMGFTLDDVKAEIKNAAQVAFLPEAKRANLIARLDGDSAQGK